MSSSNIFELTLKDIYLNKPIRVIGIKTLKTLGGEIAMQMGPEFYFRAFFFENYVFIKSSISSISMGIFRIKLNGSPVS